MKRTLPGIVLALCWLLLLLKGSFFLFGVVVLIIALIGSYEYVQMAFPDHAGNLQKGLIGGMFCLPVAGAVFFPEQPLGLMIFFSYALLIFFTFYQYRFLENGFSTFCRLSFGLLYLGFLGPHLVMLRGLPEGAAWLIILVGITAGSDTGAYFTGKNFGKNKLCPHISPNKTVEGALGGLFTAMIITGILSLFLLPENNLLLMLLLSIPLTGASIIGDLLESIIKRGTGTKDSGSILGGHGGILDRVDSMLLTAPVLYYMLILLG